MASQYDDDLKLAFELADIADTITMARYRAEDLAVETKPDLTPVIGIRQGASSSRCVSASAPRGPRTRSSARSSAARSSHNEPAAAPG